MTTGEIVKGLCNEQGLTRKALAEKAGIAEATLWRVIYNAGEVKVKTLKKIATALGVSIDYIRKEDLEPEGISAEERICLECRRKGLTLSEIAAQTGFDAKVIINAKKDIFSVEYAKLCKIAEV